MIIEKNLCVGCGACQAYCPVGAIRTEEAKAVIDLIKCVECGTCKRVKVCPTDAICQKELGFPREIRAFFSDPNCPHKNTTLTFGRGTAEMKSNEVTGRYKKGIAGFGIEMGRPGTGTTLRDIEKVSMEIAKLGVTFEELNPLTSLMADTHTGKIRDDVLDETILSAIVEFIIPRERIGEVMEKVAAVSKRIGTVFSLGLITRVEDGETLPNIEIIKKLGYPVSLNAKVNIGLGRPKFVEEGA